MKVQQTLAQTWKRRRDSDHATAKRLIAWLIPANVLVCSGMSCRDAALQNDLGDDVNGYVLALALTWGYAILWSWSIYPFVFFILAKTESRWMGFVSVLFAYGAWGFVNAIGCVVAMEAVRSGAWTPVFVWFGACIAWNACLFRSRPVSRRAKVA